LLFLPVATAAAVYVASPDNEVEARRIVGTKVSVSENDLRVAIIPAKTSFQVGDAPVFRVVMRNVSQKRFYLVGAIDGSERKWRYPHVTLTIEGPDGGVARPQLAFCGNVNPLCRRDIVLIEPGDSLEPISQPFWPPVDAHYARFAKPGEFTVKFHYSSNALDYSDWQGRRNNWPVAPRSSSC
jgi:hypothetical protein